MLDLQPVTILHVDDNETNRYVVTRMLQNAGYRVIEAVTGAEALQFAAEQRPDLVILDVKLPDIGGFEVCQRLKTDPATAFIPVLHLSATFVASKDKAQGLDSGADAYLAQPVEAIELIATIRALLRLRRAEESAVALALEWQTTFDAMSDGVCLLSSKGKILRCNQAMTQHLGKPLNEIVGGGHQDLMPVMLGLPDCNPFIQAQETRRRESLEVQFRGQWYSIAVDPMFDQQQEFTGAVYTLADIANRRRAEESVKFLSEASIVLSASLDYKTTLANLSRLVVPALADCCFFDVITVDEDIQRLACYHHDRARQEWFSQVQTYLPPRLAKAYFRRGALGPDEVKFVPEVTEEWMQAIALNADHLQFMHDLQLHSLITVPLVANAQKLGSLTLFLTEASGRHYTDTDLSLAEDLARRVALALENARLYREAKETNRMKDEFLATLSHELRSPLNAMLGWAKLLNTRQFDQATTLKAIETIERNARAQAQLIEDLLDVSRIIQGKFRLDVQPLELKGLVEAAIETVRPAADAKEIRIQAVLDPAAGPVAGDSNRLQQVIWNLLSNAIKFTNKGGRVHIRLERINSHIEITVTDTGQGIPLEFLPYVFDRFRQADNSITRTFSGLGLGLAIVRHLVELHGGTVHADSPGEGQGATFMVQLPLLPVRVDVNAPARSHPKVGPGLPFNRPPSLDGVKVLVVDDDLDGREFVAIVLEQCGAEVVTVSSAAEALTVLSQSHIDVLVSDIGMPEEDGYSLIRRVRALEQGGRIPAVALTAYARTEDRTRAIAEGFQMHLPKPVEPSELATVVASMARGTA
jgi:PAS domain S-box-containing protein